MRKLIILSLAVALSAWSCTFLVDFEEEAGTPEDCFNEMDDDGDGHADCHDQDCWDLPKCNDLYEICDNLLDDNQDGLMDCEDPLCAGDPVCQVESDLCNEIVSDETVSMYTQVYPGSAGICAMEMECRIDRTWSDGVPRCMRTAPGKGSLEPCDNDLECPFGHVCTFSEALSGMLDMARNVCLPLCSNLLNINCPETLLCMNLSFVWDEYLYDGARDVAVTACDRPICPVLGLNSGTGCAGGMETCYPTDDMMGQGYCARFGENGPHVECGSDSDCLPRHKCWGGEDGSARQCQRVCMTPEDCIDFGQTTPDCVKRPYWATYGVCLNSAVGEL